MHLGTKSTVVRSGLKQQEREGGREEGGGCRPGEGRRLGVLYIAQLFWRHVDIILAPRYPNPSDVTAKLLPPSGFITTPIVPMRREDNGSYNNCTPLHNMPQHRSSSLPLCKCQRQFPVPMPEIKTITRNPKSRSIVLFSLELEYSNHLQFLVPMPGVQVTKRRFQHQVHSSIPTRIRIFKSPEANNENPTTEKPHSNIIHSIQETTKSPRPPIQVSLINFVFDPEPPLSKHPR